MKCACGSGLPGRRVFAVVRWTIRCEACRPVKLERVQPQRVRGPGDDLMVRQGRARRRLEAMRDLVEVDDD